MSVLPSGQINDPTGEPWVNSDHSGPTELDGGWVDEAGGFAVGIASHGLTRAELDRSGAFNAAPTLAESLNQAQEALGAVVARGA